MNETLTLNKRLDEKKQEHAEKISKIKALDAAHNEAQQAYGLTKNELVTEAVALQGAIAVLEDLSKAENGDG